MSVLDIASAPPVTVRVSETPPLRGFVQCGDQPPRQFEGWVSLAAAVDASLSQARDTA